VLSLGRLLLGAPRVKIGGRINGVAGAGGVLRGREIFAGGSKAPSQQRMRRGSGGAGV